MNILSKNRSPTDGKINKQFRPYGRNLPRAFSFTALAATVGLIPAACGVGGTKTVTAEQSSSAKANTSLTIHPGPPHVESAEWSANVFKNEGMAAVIGRTVVNNSYQVTCRINPSPEEATSVASGGWYVLQSGGVVAANTFYNPPVSQNNPYDSRVPVC